MDQRFPRSLIRRIEATDLPLEALSAIREMRDYLDAVERDSIVKARTFGASTADIARALGVTRQSVYNKLRALAGTDKGTIVVPDLDPRDATR